MLENTKSNQEDLLETEAQLEMLKAIQKYSITAMQVKNRLDFLNLSVSFIANIFNQPKVFHFDINPITSVIKLITTYDCESIIKKEFIGIYPKEPFNLSISELNKVPELKAFFAFLGLENGMFCELNREDLDYSGIIICGFSKSDKNTSLIAEKHHQLFKLLIQKAGLINYLLRQNERLSKELVKRKIIEDRIAEQTIELKRSNEDLEQFAYVISHDLKAPLRNITSFSQLLKHSFSKEVSEEGKEYLGFILTGVRQFGALIDDLLLYSRAVKKAVEFEETEMELVIDAAKYNLGVLIGETETVINYENLPTLNVNFLQMTQVFQNLFSNAIKFRRKESKPVITITTSDYENDKVLFEVTDNGIGIQSEYYERIFSLFQRLHIQSEYEGTGLGLSICKKIIERHKGTIWVKSEGLEQGTTFYFLLPKCLKNE